MIRYFSIFRYLHNTSNAANRAFQNVARTQQLLLWKELDRLKSLPRYADPKHLIPYGGKSYCQCDEDGIIAEVFRRIGTTNKRFVEFGIGDGLENNTFALLFDNWHGLWIDASTKSVNSIEASLPGLIQCRRLKVVKSFITRDNINELIASNIEHDEIDLLSVDIDGNDYHVIKAITAVHPRVIVTEYNAKFLPPVLYCMEYNESHCWDATDCFGASLKFLEVKMRDQGYSLVGCNLTGANAFFVRSDLVADKFFAPYTAENHYEPARYHLIDVISGHPASYNTLANSMAI